MNASTLLVSREDCQFCGHSSQPDYPAAVVSGQWLCQRCGRWQDRRDEGGGGEVQ